MKILLRGLAFLLALLLALAAVVFVRALALDSRQVEAEAVPALPLEETALLDRFARSITYPTISAEGGGHDAAPFVALHEFLAESYPALHAALDRETVGGLSLLYRWPGTDPGREPMLLMGHLDVVPVSPGTEGDWVHPPYAGTIADGFVWGRGSLDDKASVMAILEAVESLVVEGFRPRRTVYFAFGHDEELGGSEGARAIAARLAERGAGPFALVLDEGGAVTYGQIPGIERPVAVVGIAEKGWVDLELRAEGAGGHSSTPPAETAIGVLARAITRLEADPFPMRLTGAGRALFDFVAPEMPFGYRLVFANLWLFEPLVERILAGKASTRAMLHTTTAATIVSGGVKANVLPASATATVNFRILPGETPESVAERVRTVIDDPRVTVTGAEGGRAPSPISPSEGPAFDLLARTIRQVVGPEVLVAPYLVFGGTDARHMTELSSHVYRFLPIRFEEGEMRRFHGTDERIRTRDYLDCVRFYRRLVEGAAELP